MSFPCISTAFRATDLLDIELCAVELLESNGLACSAVPRRISSYSEQSVVSFDICCLLCAGLIGIDLELSAADVVVLRVIVVRLCIHLLHRYIDLWSMRKRCSSRHRLSSNMIITQFSVRYVVTVSRIEGDIISYFALLAVNFYDLGHIGELSSLECQCLGLSGNTCSTDHLALEFSCSALDICMRRTRAPVVFPGYADS